MLAKANYPLSLHLGARFDQKNNKNWLSLSREDDCMVPERDKISCAEKLRASKILTTANEKPSEREREHVISIILQVISSHFLKNDNKTPQRRFVYLR